MEKHGPHYNKRNGLESGNAGERRNFSGEISKKKLDILS
jgi:hypothetical protein